MRLVLLPGMHGTDELFREFMSRLPEPKHIEALHYPTDVSLSYSQLLKAVESFVPATEDFVLLAESFSTPLAIQFAATKPPSLKGLILCAGFSTSPVRGWRRIVASFLTPVLFHLPLPESVCKRWLVGRDASSSLLAAVQTAVSLVHPKVLATRLRAILVCDVRPELSQVTVPILYVQAKQDCLVHEHCVDEIRRVQPQTKVVKIGGPHLILQREPKQAAQAIAEFVMQHTRATGISQQTTSLL